jgi:integrase
MPKLKLTSAAVGRLKTPETGQVDYFDATLPAFGLRVGRSKRMYFIVIRIHGKRSRITLGQAKVGDGPGMTLAEARTKAGEVIEDAALGTDPRKRRAAEKAANRKRTETTFGAVADLFIERYAKPRKRTWMEDKRILDVYVRPHWEDIPISEIARSDVVEVLDAVEERGKVMADRVLSTIRKLFNWAIDERALLDANPVGRKMARSVAGSRKRSFTDDEIRGIWNASNTIGGFKGPMIKMLMLTGQRVGVVAGMKHSEVHTEAKTWTIPGDATGRSKNKLDQVVPLPDQALAIYQSIPKIVGHDHAFSSGHRGDKAPTIGSKLSTEFKKAAGFDDWCFQNLRGLVATKMKRPLGISNEIINLVQGRLDQSVLARNYDSNDYVEDKRAAIQAWANLLDEIVIDADRANVVPIRKTKDG